MEAPVEGVVTESVAEAIKATPLPAAVSSAQHPENPQSPKLQDVDDKHVKDTKIRIESIVDKLNVGIESDPDDDLETYEPAEPQKDLLKLTPIVDTHKVGVESELTDSEKPMEAPNDNLDDTLEADNVLSDTSIDNTKRIQGIIDKLSTNADSDPDDDLDEPMDTDQDTTATSLNVDDKLKISKAQEVVDLVETNPDTIKLLEGIRLADKLGINIESEPMETSVATDKKLIGIVDTLSIDLDSDPVEVATDTSKLLQGIADKLGINVDSEPTGTDTSKRLEGVVDVLSINLDSDAEDVEPVQSDTSKRLKTIIDNLNIESDPDDVDEPVVAKPDTSKRLQAIVDKLDVEMLSDPDDDLEEMDTTTNQTVDSLSKQNEKQVMKPAGVDQKSDVSSDQKRGDVSGVVKEAQKTDTFEKLRSVGNIVDQLAKTNLNYESDPDNDLECIENIPLGTSSTTGSAGETFCEKSGLFKPNRSSDSSSEEFHGFAEPDVVTISDDEEKEDDTRKAKKRKLGPKKIPCCNAECTSTEDIPLFPAPVFVLTYFGMKYRRGLKNQVCEMCFDKVHLHHENMATALTHRIPLFELDFPDRNVAMVDLSDSDEEDEQIPEDEFLDDESLKLINENLEDLLQKVLNKYDHKFQVEASLLNLTARVAALEPEMEEINKVFENQLQDQLDSYRQDLYATYRPKIQELPPLEIIDVPEEPNTTGHLTYDVDADKGRRSLPINSVPPFNSDRPRPPSREVSILPMPQTTTTTLRTYGEANRKNDDHHFIRPTMGVATKKVTQALRPFPLQTTNQMEGIQEVVALEQVKIQHRSLPPVGSVVRVPPRAGDVMYAMKLSYFGVWARARVMEVIPKGTEMPRLKPSDPVELSACNHFKIKWESNFRKASANKQLPGVVGGDFQVTGKQLAYTQSITVRYPVGTRVIAIFRDNEWSKENYYAGIIAEPPKYINKYRYLVFFDDGYTQYVPHEKILLVVESSKNVWDDVHPDSRDFIRKYLEAYPERPMVKMSIGQIVKTEWNGRWWIARVKDVDASLVHMNFDADGRTEWMYRGSTRLGPLYAEMINAKARMEAGNFPRHRSKIDFSTLRKRNLPYVEYTRGVEAESDSGASLSEPEVEPTKPSRAVAKKSTTRKPTLMPGQTPMAGPDAPAQNRNSAVVPGGVKTDYYDLSNYPKPKKFEPHQCGPVCISWIPYDAEKYKFCGPLAVPLHCAWTRSITKSKLRAKKMVIYMSPCGRRLRTMEELSRYLRLTRSTMGVDLFDFDFWVSCLNEFVLYRTLSSIKDMSYGAEYMSVPCVNYLDHHLPEYVTYTTKREPSQEVFLNIDKEFLTGCDCIDGCLDRDKCACWQLTFAGTAFGQTGPVDNTCGYSNKRLIEPVLTGIYECNERCRCSSTCSNRVVQNPLRAKLQVFKTDNRGWGIRSLNDIPQGAFICIYAGKLLTEPAANEQGKNYGDDYLAELDYIEVVERLKEGYEEQVKRWGGEDKDDEEAENDADKEKKEASEDEAEEEKAKDSDEDFEPVTCPKVKASGIDTRSSSRLRKKMAEKGTDEKKEEQRKARLAKEKAEKEKLEKDKKNKEKVDKDKDTGKSSGETSEDGDTITVSDEEDENARKPQKFIPTKEPTAVESDDDDEERPLSFTSIRHYFEDDGNVYIMDAKNNGNIGRYLNHSCTPNVFVQNVFVDTHDLRFPWVAFFALSYIPTGTELTWDYNYDIGSVPNKKLICQCGSSECRGRLL